MMNNTLPLILALVCISSSSLAAPPVDPATLPTSTPPPPPIEVKWKERGGDILVDSVCFNYPQDSAQFPTCQQLAQKRFRRECEDLKLLYYNSGPREREAYKKGMEKYCTAKDAMAD